MAEARAFQAIGSGAGRGDWHRKPILRLNAVKAAVGASPGTPLPCREIGIPVPGLGQLPVKVAACTAGRVALFVINGALPRWK
jgi:hypothetical protein